MALTTEYKKLYEVFPTLKLSEETALYADAIYVTKVTKESSGNMARVYILSNVIIPKKSILKLEDELHRQIFRRFTENIRILDRYDLTQQHTPEKLFEFYRDSIEAELEKYFHLEYMIYKKSDVFFVDGVFVINMEKGGFSKHKGDGLRDYFSNLFTCRFGMDVEVRCQFKDSRAGRFAEENRYRLEKMAKQIAENITVEESVPLKKTEEKTRTPAPERSEERKKYYKQPKKEKSPGMIYGRDFEGEITKISDIGEAGGIVIVEGMIRYVHELRTTKTGRVIMKFDITDFCDTITAVLFLSEEAKDELKDEITAGRFITLHGDASYNNFEKEVTINSVKGIRKAADNRPKKTDDSFEKRTELRCHTKMSEMEGVAALSDLVTRAVEWGHNALAVTDNGVVQAFPECIHLLDNLKKKKKIPEDTEFKLILGMDAYMADDTRLPSVNVKGQSLDDTFVVFDLETTGLSASHDRIIEIGAVKVESGKITDRFSTFVNPQIPIPYAIEKLTFISDSMVKDAPLIQDALPKFLEFVGDAAVVGHNAEFDVSFIENKAKDIGIETDFTVTDTVRMGQFLLPDLNNYKLDTLAKKLDVELLNHHRAVDDAEATAHIFVKLIKRLKEKNIFTLKELNEAGKPGKEAVKKMHPYRCTILATTEEGKYNLYRLVSASHLDYFRRVPIIPKSLIMKHREGLIIGSGNSDGELYEAIHLGRGGEILAGIVSFYDYLEIQPVQNNLNLIESDKSYVSNEDDLRQINIKITELGNQFDKPVAATGDVYLLEPEDAIYRSILRLNKKDKNYNKLPLCIFKTTDEMLEEFSYLGSDKAREVVIENTRKISDMCDNISPVRPDKCSPQIEGSDEQLKEICYNRAHEIYGEELPDIVKERLDKELDSIISNGYSVLYIIAQKLVWKSNDDGYLVGSRGSVGSSFAAYMLGITEVNPLSPHYRCTGCFYTEFDSEEVLSYSGASGCDMPDKICPKCGRPLTKDGFDIPFETFLGFKGDKEPDIDLNFSNEYQSKAHAFTEVIFGKGQTFKAGTVSGVQDKTAFGFTMAYFEEEALKKNEAMTKRGCEIARIAEGCIGVKRTTGQHPGGIIVLPIGEDINTFTPVQHPANDTGTDIITTHFDYHSIDHNLLKLDILGHLDPTMIRRLQDLTGKDPLTIPLDSKEVMSLFKDTSALGIKPEDIGGTELGILGVPEFGTDFAMGMVKEAAPTSFSDLIRIAGLAHGTDVWLDNAQKLISEGTATISTAICTRDDIMTYLISMGLEKELSFTIMESVRKGKGLKPEWEEEMVKHNVPDWYIWSCKKIQYMFPKAHAAAYVMMAWRIAYCKIFHPLEYYCAYFSIREKGFDYEKMAMGESRFKTWLETYRNKNEESSLTDVEANELKDLRIVEEMYARGFEFMPVDIYKAGAREFRIYDGKLMPSFKVISKVGEVAGENIEIAAAKGPFISKEDIMKRAGVGQTVIDKLTEINALDGMADTNQLTIFDV